MQLLGSLVVAAVLAAMAVFGDASACPLGRTVHVDSPALPWHSKVVARSWQPPSVPPTPPNIAVLTGDAALARAIERELATARCGVGRGELVVRVSRRMAIATVTGLDRATASCVEHAIAAMSVRRIADDAVVRVAIDLR